MFERFNESARQVVVLSQDEARALKHNYVGTEHILLGLLREDRGFAAEVLGAFGITDVSARARVTGLVGPGEGITAGQIPFTPRAKKVLEIALREALSLGHNYIGDEHILLGLIRENEGVAASVLLDFDVGPEQIRNEVIRQLSGPGGRNRTGGARSAGTLRAEDSGFAVRPDNALRRLLMAAGGRALLEERTEYGMADLLAVAEELAETGTPQQSEPGAGESQG